MPRQWRHAPEKQPESATLTLRICTTHFFIHGYTGSLLGAAAHPFEFELDELRTGNREGPRGTLIAPPGCSRPNGCRRRWLHRGASWTRARFRPNAVLAGPRRRQPVCCSENGAPPYHARRRRTQATPVDRQASMMPTMPIQVGAPHALSASRNKGQLSGRGTRRRRAAGEHGPLGMTTSSLVRDALQGILASGTRVAVAIGEGRKPP